VEKEASFTLGLLAVKPEYQTKIAEQNALPGLVRLLTQYNISAPKDAQPSRAGAARRAADAITNLAHENVEIKNMVCVCVSMHVPEAAAHASTSNACKYLISMRLSMLALVCTCARMLARSHPASSHLTFKLGVHKHSAKMYCLSPCFFILLDCFLDLPFSG